MSDIIIVGGGIIGLLTARELLQAGLNVTLLEQSGLGQEASWAGGGIVSPLYPWTYSEPVTALASWAQDYYPRLVDELHAETGLDAELNACGLLMLDRDDAGDALQWACQNGKAMTSLRSTQVAELEPSLTVAVREGLWMPYVSNIRNPRLLKVLVAALHKHPGFTAYTQARVHGFRQLENGQVCVLTEQCQAGGLPFVADNVVVCSGAWTRELLQPLGLAIPVLPVRGQMLLFEPRPGLLKHIVLRQGKYLIPRLDGHIVAGSTLEYTGFDCSTTVDARDLLWQQAVNMIAELEAVPVKAQWAGLRPGSPAGIPYIGALPGWKGLYVNAGHFRNGLVLAPASARLMADLITHRRPIVDPAPYNPAQARPDAEMH